MINKDTKWITTGLFSAMFSGNDEDADRSICFRREFELYSDPVKAELYICALGLGVCTINGKRVTEDVLTTPYTHYDRRAIYQKYDVTRLLQKGANAVGVHVGNGFYNNNMETWNDKMAPWRACPKLAAVLCVKVSGGRQICIETDEEWKCNPGPCVYNHMRQGEIFDARLAQSGYDSPGFDDRKWQYAMRTFAPGGMLEEDMAPPIRITEVIEPVRYENGIYDFGVNISGWAAIIACGEAGREIRLSYDEALDEKGDLLRGAAVKYADLEKKLLCHEDIYICAGRGKEEYHPNFCYHGFRYVKVENAPDDFKITAHFVHTDLEQVGSFSCSNEDINKIHEMCIRSTRANFVGIPTDCPHREQNGWTGDALVSADTTLINFDAYNAYRKWMHDFTDAQRDNGHLPGIIPTAGWGYTGCLGPAWDGAVVLIPYKTYLYTGRTEIILDMWATMVKYMRFLESMSSEYLVGYGLGDWCPPVFEDRVSNVVTDTAFYYESCCAMAKMAEKIGTDSSIWDSLAAKIREAWRKRFVKLKGEVEQEEYCRYQTFFACALYYQFYNDEQERSYFLQSLLNLIREKEYHIDCGILGTRYLFDVLAENGQTEIALKVITNPTYPGYGYWIHSGMTTLCETWNMGSSRNHQMFGSVDNWFYRYLGGIRFTDAGVVIDPVFVDAVERVSVEHRGIRMERNGRSVRLLLPCKAKIRIEGKLIEIEAGSYQYHI